MARRLRFEWTAIDALDAWELEGARGGWMGWGEKGGGGGTSRSKILGPGTWMDSWFLGMDRRDR